MGVGLLVGVVDPHAEAEVDAGVAQRFEHDLAAIGADQVDAGDRREDHAPGRAHVLLVGDADRDVDAHVAVHAVVDDGAVDDLLVGHHHVGVLARADARRAHLDLGHLACDVAGRDPVPDAEGSVQEDGDPRDDVGDRVLGGQAHRDARHAQARDRRGDVDAHLPGGHDHGDHPQRPAEQAVDQQAHERLVHAAAQQDLAQRRTQHAVQPPEEQQHDQRQSQTGQDVDHPIAEAAHVAEQLLEVDGRSPGRRGASLDRRGGLGHEQRVRGGVEHGRVLRSAGRP